MIRLFILSVKISGMYMILSLNGFAGMAPGPDTVFVRERKNSFTRKIDSYIRLSDRRLADFRTKDFYMEWSSRSINSGTGGFIGPNSDFMKSCAYRMDEKEKNLYFRESLMRYKLINTQMLLDHAKGMRWGPVFIKVK